MSSKAILVIQAADGPDYLADLVSHFLYQQATAKLETNKHPEYLFSDFPKDTLLYGRGFTAYRKIGQTLRSNIKLRTAAEISERIRLMLYSKIIWTSVRRSRAHLEEALNSKYEKCQLLVLDGEDDQAWTTHSGINLWERCTYYKRELNLGEERLADSPLPISFKFPQSVFKSIPIHDKCRILATCDPRFINTYVFTSEADYYTEYSQSLFAFTTQKSGWDCLRHYEILACNCLPVFPGVETMPATTMHEWDRGLQREVNALWHDVSNTVCRDIDQYLSIWDSLMIRFRHLFLERMTTTQYSFLLS